MAESHNGKADVVVRKMQQVFTWGSETPTYTLHLARYSEERWFWLQCKCLPTASWHCAHDVSRCVVLYSVAQQQFPSWQKCTHTHTFVGQPNGRHLLNNSQTCIHSTHWCVLHDTLHHTAATKVTISSHKETDTLGMCMHHQGNIMGAGFVYGCHCEDHVCSAKLCWVTAELSLVAHSVWQWLQGPSQTKLQTDQLSKVCSWPGLLMGTAP